MSKFLVLSLAMLIIVIGEAECRVFAALGWLGILPKSMTFLQGEVRPLVAEMRELVARGLR